ncbi:MAG TPA: TIM barrel protein [Acidobacteriota bacterium]|nr:TIM barrel protein [Acidobacteriota bacterium]
MTSRKLQNEQVSKALDELTIELPSWGFANTGTRFGKFIQLTAATTIEEKLIDAGEVHRLMGCCPSVAVHAGWDFPDGQRSAELIASIAEENGVRIGSVNPTLFEDQMYKYGSIGNPDPDIRAAALDHILESVDLARQVGSRELVLWFADGSNYPGTANIRQRKEWFESSFQLVCSRLNSDERMLVEYKPFEPAFYHTDIADWGMALSLARKAGPQAKVLVDTGHHYPSQNIEQIVAWLLSEGMLGGFHFNDRRYADDDLTVGSIDPYQLFRIFHEIYFYRWDTGSSPQVSYMVDQSHNLKNKIEAMLQTVNTVQETVAKAVIVDHERLALAQAQSAILDAEECLKNAYSTDVRPLIREWRKAHGLPRDPLKTFRESDYLKSAEIERAERNRGSASGYVSNH